MSVSALFSILFVVTLGVAFAIWRTRMAIGFQIAFLLRFQMFLLFAPVIIVALSWTLATVFGNLMILQKLHEGVLLGAVAFGTSWLALPLTIIVLDHAGERFRVGTIVAVTDDDCESIRAFRAPAWFWNWSFVLYTIPPLLLALRVSCASGSLGVTAGLALGAVVSFLAVIVIDAAALLLAPDDSKKHRFIFLSSSYPEGIGRWLQEREPLRNLHLRWLACLGPGYVDRNGRPYADQIAAAFVFGATVLCYTASFEWGWYRLGHGHTGTGVPALSYLEFLIATATIILAGAAFWLDRYRISVLLTVTVYSVMVSTFFYTDHYWRASRTPQPTSTGTDNSVVFTDGIDAWLTKYSNSNDVLHINRAPVAIVVCASGGGIEAAAWTAKVLTGLQTELGKPFSRSIRLISSASGGSVGSLFFVQSFFSNKDAPDSQQLDNIYDASKRPSLGASGWGMANPDFARLLAPWILPIWFRIGPGAQARYVDRGWALEQSWRLALHDPKNPAGYIDSNLSDWRAMVNAGLLPGTVFNATMVESGAPLLLSTLQIPLMTSQMATSGGASQPPRAWLFGQRTEPEDMDVGADISNVTAARLSATFPYVSPVARGCYDTKCEGSSLPVAGQHIADGGYYDNYGVSVAIEWVNSIAHKYGPSGSGKLAKILIILIDAFPEGVDQAPKLNPHGGWGSEILGPIKTAINARSETQLGRDDIELGLLSEVAGKPDSNTSCGNFVSAFRFIATAQTQGAPLSWQLSHEQEENIRADWNTPTMRNEVARMKECLGIKTPPSN